MKRISTWRAAATWGAACPFLYMSGPGAAAPTALLQTGAPARTTAVTHHTELSNLVSSPPTRLCHTDPMADLFSDQPLTDPNKGDELGRRDFARELAKSILTINTDTSYAYSIEGDWGSGKSTILEFTKYYLKHRTALGVDVPLKENPIIIDVPLWWFSGSEDLLHQFLGQISAQLRSKVPKALKRLPSLFENFSDGLTIAATVAPPLAAAIPAAKAAAAIAKRAAAPKDVHAIREKIEKLLEKPVDRIVVFLDDIDRLQPQEILQVFQVVKAIAALPRLIYVLAFDRAAVASALEHAGIKDPARYIEKIVQSPWPLPMPTLEGMDQLTTGMVNTIVRDTAASRWSQHRWHRLYYGDLYHGDGLIRLIRTPRDAKRLANALRPTYPPVRTEVDAVDFIVFQALRVLAPPAYDFIREHREWLAGPLKTFRVVRYADPQANEKVFQSMIDKLEGPKQGPVVFLLHELFPALNPGAGGGIPLADISHTDLAAWRAGGRVCSPDCFDYYDRLSIPTGAITSAELGRILNSEFAVTLGAELRRLADDQSSGRPQLIKFVMYASTDVRQHVASENAPRLLTNLFQVADPLIPRTGPSSVSIDHVFENLALAIVEFLPTEERLPALTHAWTDGSSISLMARCLYSKERMASLIDQPGIATLNNLFCAGVKSANDRRELARTPRLHLVLDLWEQTEPDDAHKGADLLSSSEEGFIALVVGCLSPYSLNQSDPSNGDMPRIDRLRKWTSLSHEELSRRCATLLPARQGDERSGIEYVVGRLSSET